MLDSETPRERLAMAKQIQRAAPMKTLKQPRPLQTRGLGGTHPSSVSDTAEGPGHLGSVNVSRSSGQEQLHPCPSGAAPRLVSLTVGPLIFPQPMVLTCTWPPAGARSCAGHSGLKCMGLAPRTPVPRGRPGVVPHSLSRHCTGQAHGMSAHRPGRSVSGEHTCVTSGNACASNEQCGR